MNHACSIIVVPALALAAVVLTSAQATATVPQEDAAPAAVVPHDPGPPNYPSYEVPVDASANTNTTIPADDTAVDVLQAGAFALGGAGIAIAGSWLYRRRQAPIA